MARRHWLDPLARRLLIASGHLPSPEEAASRKTAAHEAAVERELEALKRVQAAGRVDVNRATASDWRGLPGCTAEQADLLVRLQAQGVQLSGPEDLQRLLRLDPPTLQAWLPRLAFHWYGEPAPLGLPPVAINRAGSAELQDRLALSGERLRRLRQERARGPFRDLADLQQRLMLPATLVETWIGKVSFEPPEPQEIPIPAPEPPAQRSERGPSLPPTRSRSTSLPRPGRQP